MPVTDEMETTAEERAVYAKVVDEEFVWPESGFVGRLIRDIDRLLASEGEAVRLREAAADIVDVYCYPIDSDTDVATFRVVDGTPIHGMWLRLMNEVRAAIRKEGGDHG